MKHLLIAVLLVSSVQAQTVVQRVGEDAIAIDRVAAASKKDLPRDLLKRIVEEDIDLLRGKRSDGTYEYASFERFDSGRITQDFSVKYRKDKMDVLEVKGAFVYRVQVEVPSRRLLVRRNRPVWIERVDLDYLPERGSQSARQSIEVKQWLKPGEFRPLDLPDIARQATVRVVATVEEKSGYGNVEIALIKARIVDNADSLYGDAVASAKAIQRGLENNDVPSIRAMAQRLRHGLEGGQVGRLPAVPVEVSRPASSVDSEMRGELQAIEDLLTGTEPERREGMDRLHQLIRRLRQ